MVVLCFLLRAREGVMDMFSLFFFFFLWKNLGVSRVGLIGREGGDKGGVVNFVLTSPCFCLCVDGRERGRKGEERR